MRRLVFVLLPCLLWASEGHRLRVYGPLPHRQHNMSIYEVIVGEDVHDAEAFFIASAQRSYDAVLDLDNDGERDTVLGPLIPVELEPFTDTFSWGERSHDFLYRLETGHLRVLGQYLASLFQAASEQDWLPSFLTTPEELDYILGLCLSGGPDTNYYLGWIMPWTPEHLLRPLGRRLRSTILDCLVIGDDIRGAWISTEEYGRLRDVLSPPSSPDQSYSPRLLLGSGSSDSEDDGAVLQRALHRIIPPKQQENASPDPNKAMPNQERPKLGRKTSFQRFQEVKAMKEATMGMHAIVEDSQSATDGEDEDVLVEGDCESSEVSDASAEQVEDPEHIGAAEDAVSDNEIVEDASMDREEGMETSAGTTQVITQVTEEPRTAEPLTTTVAVTEGPGTTESLTATERPAPIESNTVPVDIEAVPVAAHSAAPVITCALPPVQAVPDAAPVVPRATEQQRPTANPAVPVAHVQQTSSPAPAPVTASLPPAQPVAIAAPARPAVAVQPVATAPPVRHANVVPAANPRHAVVLPLAPSPPVAQGPAPIPVQPAHNTVVPHRTARTHTKKKPARPTHDKPDARREYRRGHLSRTETLSYTRSGHLSHTEALLMHILQE